MSSDLVLDNSARGRLARNYALWILGYAAAAGLVGIILNASFQWTERRVLAWLAVIAFILTTGFASLFVGWQNSPTAIRVTPGTIELDIGGRRKEIDRQPIRSVKVEGIPRINPQLVMTVANKRTVLHFVDSRIVEVLRHAVEGQPL